MNNTVDVICSNELITFPNRKTAIKFFYECMSMCEGAERDRYTNIYMELTSSKTKMVSDEDDYFNEPIIYSTSKFVGDHCEYKEKLPKAMKYKEYLKYKKEKQKVNKDKYYILGDRLGKVKRDYYESKGFFCYDLSYDDLDDIIWVQKNVLANHIGAIITTKDINLEKYDGCVELDKITDKFEDMSYEEFCKIEYKENKDELIR